MTTHSDLPEAVKQAVRAAVGDAVSATEPRNQFGRAREAEAIRAGACDDYMVMEAAFLGASAALSALRSEGMVVVPQLFETAPKDGKPFHAWGPDSEWPETIRWCTYDPDDAEEVGAPGCWIFAEELMADVADCEEEAFTHWAPLPPTPVMTAASPQQEGE